MTMPLSNAASRRAAPDIRPAAPIGHAPVGAWTAIILAGSRPGTDPLAAHFGLGMKSLVRIDGEAMVSRVAKTLLAVPEIGRVVVLAQDVDGLRASPDLGWERGEPRLSCARSGAGISRSILDFARDAGRAYPLLVTTADNVLLTPAIAGAFLGGAEGDVSIGLVSRATLVARYPQSVRSWMRFRGGAYTGANLFALRSAAVRPALELWHAVEQDRKKLLRIAARFGPRLLARVATRSITLDDAIARAGARLGIDARAVVLDHAEAGIDVDKLSDFALAEAVLRARRP